jgi:hypothetical protein
VRSAHPLPAVPTELPWPTGDRHLAEQHPRMDLNGVNSEQFEAPCYLKTGLVSHYYPW